MGDAFRVIFYCSNKENGIKNTEIIAGIDIEIANTSIESKATGIKIIEDEKQ